MKIGRRKMRLGLLCLSVLSTASFFFVRSSNNVRENHRIVLNRLEEIGELEQRLAGDVVRVRAFLNPNYDSLVRSSLALQDQCNAFLVGAHKITGLYGSTFDGAIRSYCADVDERVEMVEELKSAASIVRNSIEYLPELNKTQHLSKISAEDDGTRALLVSCLAYVSRARVDARAGIELQIRVLEQTPRLSPNGSSLIRHARAILTLIPKMDDLVTEITVAKDREKLRNALQPTYLIAFAAAEKTALFFRSCFMLSFIALLGFTLFVLTKLWKSTGDLATANETLEAKVASRTSELNASLHLVSEQQATLLQNSKMSALGEMAGGIAHEINTPLATISLSVEHLRTLAPGSGEDGLFVSELYDNVEKTIDRIGKIINGLRNFSRDGSLDTVARTRVADVVADTCALCQERFSSQGTRLEIELQDKNMVFECRRVEITQVLLNLLGNSHDAIRELPDRWIKLEARQTESGTEISVTDSGSGIPKEIAAKIMQPFFTTKPVGKGTGLGLSLSSGILKAHGGSLIIDQACANTRFIIFVPSPKINATAA